MIPEEDITYALFGIEPASSVATARRAPARSGCHAVTMTSSVVERLRRHFAERPGEVKAAYVFGSEARGTAGADSDVDVAVLLGRRPAATDLRRLASSS